MTKNTTRRVKNCWSSQVIQYCALRMRILVVFASLTSLMCTYVFVAAQFSYFDGRMATTLVEYSRSIGELQFENRQKLPQNVRRKRAVSITNFTSLDRKFTENDIKPKMDKEFDNKRILNEQFNRSAFGDKYKLNTQRNKEYDFPFIINGSNICQDSDPPLLVIMVPSVHTRIDLRTAIRETWGRAANPGVWPRMGKLIHEVKLIFLFGTSRTKLGNSIVKEESEMFGDVVQADFVDSYFNLTYKTVMGVRWVAEMCPHAKYILKADDDVFVNVRNLLDFLLKQKENTRGVIYGHKLVDSAVLREGRWAVSEQAYPLKQYPPYTCGNTYVISANMAANIYYTAGLLPYLNIEDVFVTGILRMYLRADIQDVLGFTHWYEKRPRPCEFNNKLRISATKVTEGLLYDIFEGLRANVTDCYVPPSTKSDKVARPEKKYTYQMIKDDHIFLNKTSGQFYIL
ncbi:beta-1,3-galactosyltransferase 1-like [Mya arenaria]|uniref:beta-1,3-galactosyltransferase 1-like n=1 Tax=Mya arenaria TaxID=6604 RepID=UPI0022E50755|nr:beta-1,3-galactosyltransferase 1-like [Mya arenaria]